MEIVKSNVNKLKVTGVKNLDPVHIYLEDIEKGKGRITFSCYGKVWTAYFCGLGSRTISEFIIETNNDYLIEKISDTPSEIPDNHKIQMAAEKAGKWAHDNCHQDMQMMSDLYGSPFDMPMTENPDYNYLVRICNAVRDALKVVKDLSPQEPTTYENLLKIDGLLEEANKLSEIDGVLEGAMNNVCK